MLRKTIKIFLYCLSLVALSIASAGASELMIINARLIDGTGAPPKSHMSIRIQDDRITEIGQNLPITDETVLDVAGATVMPGLIDSHVHLSSVPGAGYRHEDLATMQERVYYQLKAYLAVGVTTVLDTGIGAPVLRSIQDHLTTGGIGPRVYALGPTFITKNGYDDDPRLWPDEETRALFVPAVESREDVVALFDSFADIPDIIGAKVMLEKGMLYWNVWPIFSPEMREIIMEESEKRHLPIWVHAMTQAEQATALTMKPHTIAHACYMVESPTLKHIDNLAAAGVYVNSTQMALKSNLGEVHPEWYDTPLARLTVPEEMIETAKDPDAWELLYSRTFDIMIPDSGLGFMKNFMKSVLYSMRQLGNQTAVNNSATALRRMYNAGVPIAMGSDAGNWTIIPNQFHGLNTILEMESMYNDAKIPLNGIIDSSTRIPAEMMGQTDKIGTVEAGKFADLIVLKDDPLSTINAYRTLLWTIKAGVAKTPQEWMNE